MTYFIIFIEKCLGPAFVWDAHSLEFGLKVEERPTGLSREVINSLAVAEAVQGLDALYNFLK